MSIFKLQNTKNISRQHIIHRLFRGRTWHFSMSLLRAIFLIAVSYILLYPLSYMISASLKEARDFFDPTVVWVPKNFSLNNFKLALEAMEYNKSVINTLIIEVSSSLIEVISCAVAAYGLARFQFKEKKLLNGILLGTILIPTQMILIPMMLNFRNFDVFGILGLLGQAVKQELRFNLLNTPFSFYLPSIFAVGLRSGLFIFIYMQFYKGMPKELEEASWIDGAGPLSTFIRVIIPLSGVPMLTVTIFSVIWHWNDYYFAAMYLSKNYPLSVQLASIFKTLEAMGYSPYNQSTAGIVMAACLLTVVPMLILYLLLQKQFIKSIDRVGIVG